MKNFKLEGKRVHFMKAFVLGLFIGLAPSINSQDLLQWVQPMAGTAPSTTKAALLHSETGSEKNANTMPAVGMPFGMTQWTPQTRRTEQKCIPPYFYNDSLIKGFRASHWISGSCTQDYGSFSIIPVIGKLNTTVEALALPFSHTNEQSSPAMYSLKFPAQKLNVRMTATERCGLLEFTLHKDDSLYLVIMPNSEQHKGWVQVDAATGVVLGNNPAHRIYQGWGEPAGFSGHYYFQVNKKPASAGTFSEQGIHASTNLQDLPLMGAYMGFKLAAGETISIRVGSSFTGIEGALKNLETEMPDFDFDKYLQHAKKVWNQLLGRLKVETKNEVDKRIFYTSLYHAYQHPRIFNDVDGAYPRFAGKGEIMQGGNRNYYDDFSMWDIYRAQLPLVEITQPNRVNDLVQSLVLKGSQGGWMPIFPCWNQYTSAMVGDHANVVIASAFNKGFKGFDIATSYALMRKNAFEIANKEDYENGMGRRALDSYLQHGYIPLEDSVPIAFHKKEQVSRTLEYAFDDYALATMALKLGKQNDYKMLQRRSLNYRNVFDASKGLMRGRFINGSWYEPFKPDSREPYITEGTPRHYSFYVPHDANGLGKLMGGPAVLEKALDTLFNTGQYWHGNEPGHQIPFLYNFTPSPHKTQERVATILAEEYGDGPGGLSGNDDAGQMSAWYVFASMGLYPVDPVSGLFQLTTPLFDAVSMQVSGGKRFSIHTKRKTPGDIYIQKVLLNGLPWTRNYISYAQIMKGGKLEVFTGPKPSAWGAAVADRAVYLLK